jgi:pSer/pThr/pTyr-binding forkhead associated (FHA) protein
MTAKLFCKTGELKGASYVIADKATIGKDSANTICLRPTTLSRRHASIFFDTDQGCYFLQDEDSRNGTRLDGVLVKGTEKLRHLHIITLADEFDFIFQVMDEQAQNKILQTPISTPKEKDVLPDKPVIVEQTWSLPAGVTFPKIIEEDKTIVGTAFVPLPQIVPAIAKNKTEDKTEDKTVPASAFVQLPKILPAVPVKLFLLERSGASALALKEGENTVGREKGATSPRCDIVIDHNSLSRRHAIVKVANGTVTVRDLGSKNKTFVNGKAVEGEVVIVSGSEVAFGLVKTILKESV